MCPRILVFKRWSVLGFSYRLDCHSLFANHFFIKQILCLYFESFDCVFQSGSSVRAS